MGILPHGFCDDERRVRIERREDRHTLFLGADETVFLGRLVGVGADEFVTKLSHGGGECLLHRVLGGPADFVGGLAEVAVGDEEDGFHWGHKNQWERLARENRQDLAPRMHSIPNQENG